MNPVLRHLAMLHRLICEMSEQMKMSPPVSHPAFRWLCTVLNKPNT
jgi:hypothetical protein